MTRRFAVTFDYLCPFARNAHEHVVAALREGADWEVSFVPFSLAQSHVGEDEVPVWERDDPDAVAGLLALQVGLAVREHAPASFPDVHEALFAARHDHGRDIKEREVLAAVLDDAGLDREQLLRIVDEGGPMKTLRSEHEEAVERHAVWGVPTFIAGDRAVFVRFLDRPEGDGARGRRHVESTLDLVEGAPHLHEFKQTDLPV